MQIHNIPSLRSPIALVAFSGWNDAGEAATGALTHLLESFSEPHRQYQVIAEVDSEDFYDFQVNRPLVSIDDSHIRQLTWPGTQVYSLETPSLAHDFVIFRGVEPSMKWPTFVRGILDLADDLEISQILTFGSMLADTPHTRPITVSVTGAAPAIAERLGIEISKYEGPTGILGVLQEAAYRRGIETISLWAAIPHYAPNAPSPKATLALLTALEDFLGIEISSGDLFTASQSWEDDVTQMAEDDSEIADYVKALEENKDAVSLSDTSGESIARELERFLRRQGEE